MLIIGCDFHAGFEVLAIFDNRKETITERRLSHPAEAMAFYRELQAQGEQVRVGMEAGAPDARGKVSLDNPGVVIDGMTKINGLSAPFGFAQSL